MQIVKNTTILYEPELWRFRLRDCCIHISVGFEVAYLYVSGQVRRPEE